MPSAPATPLAAALGGELTSSEATFRVIVTAGGLAVLGLVLLLFTIWWWRGTRPESPVLGPLEVMSERRWRHASEGERRRLVDDNRPRGSMELAEHPVPQPIDLSVLARDVPSNFDDLREPMPVVLLDGAVGPSAPAEADASAHEGDEHEVGPADSQGIETGPSGPDQADDPDATMHQVDRPEVVAVNGEQHDDGPDQDDQDDEVGPADELVIDPLLQRTASPD